MWQRVKEFREDDIGAVSVDWVVLTAGILTLGLLIGTTISDKTAETAGDLGETVATIDTGYRDFY